MPLFCGMVRSTLQKHTFLTDADSAQVICRLVQTPKPCTFGEGLVYFAVHVCYQWGDLIHSTILCCACNLKRWSLGIWTVLRLFSMYENLILSIVITWLLLLPYGPRWCRICITKTTPASCWFNAQTVKALLKGMIQINICTKDKENKEEIYKNKYFYINI